MNLFNFNLDKLLLEEWLLNQTNDFEIQRYQNLYHNECKLYFKKWSGAHRISVNSHISSKKRVLCRNNFNEILKLNVAFYLCPLE
jgi:hypothetical protein